MLWKVMHSPALSTIGRDVYNKSLLDILKNIKQSLYCAAWPAKLCTISWYAAVNYGKLLHVDRTCIAWCACAAADFDTVVKWVLLSADKDKDILKWRNGRTSFLFRQVCVWNPLCWRCAVLPTTSGLCQYAPDLCISASQSQSAPPCILAWKVWLF